jgi:hypothetical protein
MWQSQMNDFLQQLFSSLYNELTVPPDHLRGASSTEYTQKLRHLMLDIFTKYNIRSMFDAGCNDCTWMSRLIDIEYHGGDISPSMVSQACATHPGINATIHDATTDPFPMVDLLFVRDVTIHLSQQDKLKLLNNWVASGIPWLMITQDPDIDKNIDTTYDSFPLALVNWHLDPWNFHAPTDLVYEMLTNQGKSMSLWHVNQLRTIINELR